MAKPAAKTGGWPAAKTAAAEVRSWADRRGLPETEHKPAMAKTASHREARQQPGPAAKACGEIGGRSGEAAAKSAAASAAKLVEPTLSAAKPAAAKPAAVTASLRLNPGGCFRFMA